MSTSHLSVSYRYVHREWQLIENQLKQEAELQQKREKEVAAAESDRKKHKQEAQSDSDDDALKPEGQ